MLKGISPLLSPELLKVLMEMGHGDEIVLADSNFPAASHAQRLVRADGISGPALLGAVLELFPLDYFVKTPAALMAIVSGDNYQPPVWNSYRELVSKADPKFKDFEMMERHAFYARAKAAYAVVATGETARYANIIIKKGVIG